MKTAPWVLPVVALAVLATSPAMATPLRQVMLDYETGPLYVFRNDQRYGVNGTWFEAPDVGQRQLLFLSHRPSVELTFWERHKLVLVYAPVRLETQSTLAQAIRFNGVLFPRGLSVDHRYRFDGYRGSYLFRAVQGGRFQFEAGASVQVRNAEAALSGRNANLYAMESDIGFVPALKLRAMYQAQWGPYVMFDVDGLSSFGLGDTEGGLLDAALTVGLPFSPATDAFFRLRVYGGGADVPERNIVNWAWFGIASFGVRSDVAALLD